jgi:polyisoprenoid-binding protein YceI
MVGVQACAAIEIFDLSAQHTHPTFDVIRLGFLHTPGIFNDASGELLLDRSAKTGSIEVIIRTGSLSTGIEARDDYLKGSEFFNVSSFPIATVTAKDFNLNGQFPMHVDGSLTMLGVTKPISLTIVAMQCDPPPSGQKAICKGRVNTTIQRSEWGMSRYLLFVANAVTIDVEVTATSKQ